MGVLDDDQRLYRQPFVLPFSPSFFTDPNVSSSTHSLAKAIFVDPSAGGGEKTTAAPAPAASKSLWWTRKGGWMPYVAGRYVFRACTILMSDWITNFAALSFTCAEYYHPANFTCCVFDDIQYTPYRRREFARGVSYPLAAIYPISSAWFPFKFLLDTIYFERNIIIGE
jgi:hypothetical protein